MGGRAFCCRGCLGLKPGDWFVIKAALPTRSGGTVAVSFTPGCTYLPQYLDVGATKAGCVTDGACRESGDVDEAAGAVDGPGLKGLVVGVAPEGLTAGAAVGAAGKMARFLVGGAIAEAAAGGGGKMALFMS